MLTSRILFPPLSDPESIDIFHSSLSWLFPDDTQHSHGDPGGSLIYQSPRYGEIQIQIPVHPDLDAGRRLFAHYLWNAGVLLADLIEQASDSDTRSIEIASPDLHQDFFRVCGKTVLELGAGTALPSLVAIRSAASEVCVTDHPSSPALSSGAIKINTDASLELAKGSQLHSRVSIEAHEWGLTADAFAQETRHHYSKIVSADCLWMPSQHRNIILSISHFLSKEDPSACALVVAGFHTGRDVVADFFKQFPTPDGDKDLAQALSIAEIYETDMNGARRPWQESRAGEGREDAKRWCVVAVIVRSERTKVKESSW